MLTETSSANGHAPAEAATAPRRRLPRTVRPARTTRRLARVPSRIAIGALLVLAAVGRQGDARAPRTASTPAAAAPATDARDITAQGFAQAFARAYLSWDARDPEQHQRQVAAVPVGLARRRRRAAGPAAWPAAGAVEHGDPGPARRARATALITVAVQTTRQLLYLAVPVHRTARGFLVVRAATRRSSARPSAIPRSRPPRSRDVTDDGLRAVAQRAVTNYLAGERTNLLADLDAGAVVSLPTVDPRRAVGALDHARPRATASRSS